MLKQEYDSMFERNIAIIASRKKEVTVRIKDELYDGYICGLDDIWLQLYGHHIEDADDPKLSWRFVLLNKDNIDSITPNGRDLQHLAGETRVWVDKRISNFSSTAEKFLKESKELTNGNDRR